MSYLLFRCTPGRPDVYLGLFDTIEGARACCDDRLAGVPEKQWHDLPPVRRERDGSFDVEEWRGEYAICPALTLPAAGA